MHKLTQALKWRWNIIVQIIQKKRWAIKTWLIAGEKEKVNGISIVVVGRNDNYGGDFSERLKTTLDWNLKHLPNAELIYIEWNQISSRSSDCNWITERYPNAKCYIVPNEIHQQVCENPKMPVMEYFAKNLGIRMAQNEWILMINADVFLGTDTISNLSNLSRNMVYGTHYVSIRWDKHPINKNHLEDKSIRVVAFAATKNLGAVVGNFILTHKQNWLKATGYDERLTSVRAGVDTNGLNQLLYTGLKPGVLGHHFHLDHPESIIHGTNSTHGTHNFDNIPYKNHDNWGFKKYSVVKTGNRIWTLL